MRTDAGEGRSLVENTESSCTLEPDVQNGNENSHREMRCGGSDVKDN
jgi:hypothetical protein